MKYVTATEAKAVFAKLVAEIESTGDDVVITRDGVPIARLTREKASPYNDELTPEQVERRCEA